MHTTPSEILYYVIHYKPRHTNQPYVEISGIITLYYTVRNLSPYTEYEFYVMGMNNLGRGPPSPSAVVITGETGMMHIKNNIDFYFNRVYINTIFLFHKTIIDENHFEILIA